MSSLSKQSRKVEKGELTLVLNAAEGRLQLVIGRLAGQGSRRDLQAPGGLKLCGEAGGELEILAAQDWMAVSQGAELLTPALQQALGNLRLAPEHIGRIAVVNGPGSFTGLRLACVSAAALARGCRALQAPLEYLPLLASGIWEAGLANFLPQEEGSPLTAWVITYARRGLVYLQGFSLAAGPGFPAPPAAPGTPGLAGESPLPGQAAKQPGSAALPVKISDLQVLEPEAAADFLRLQHEKIHGLHLLLGSGLTKNRELLENSPAAACPRLRFLPASFDLPTPAMLLRQAHGLEYSEADVAPLYVRTSDAEENLPQIAAKLGLDPEYALRRLEDLLRE